jgi:hypothetical protein
MTDFIGLLEIFGGTSVVIIGIYGCISKCIQSYDITYKWGSSITNRPTETLDICWEHNGKPKEIHDFGTSYNRFVFGTKTEDNKWDVKMNVGEGSVFIYKNIFNKPTINDEHHYLRIKLKNAPKNGKIKFCHKYFQGEKNCWEYSVYHPEYNETLDVSDNIHTFYSKSLIDNHIGDDNNITKEQIGIHFDASNVDYDCTIEEAYCGKKYNIMNIIFWNIHILTIFYIHI